MQQHRLLYLRLKQFMDTLILGIVGCGVIPPLADVAQLLTTASPRHWSGAAIPSSNVWKCPSIRVMVPVSNKSVLYSKAISPCPLKQCQVELGNSTVYYQRLQR